MRKKITREITKTTAKVGRMEMGEDGLPVAIPLPDVILLGNATLEQAQRKVRKEHGTGVVVFKVETDTHTYEMPVEQFINEAKIKEEKAEESDGAD